MAKAQSFGWGMAGAAASMLARTATRRAMHVRTGAPRLPRAVRRRNSFGTMILLAVATGVILALGDVLQEQRKRVTRHSK
jgi:hypothetical protein